MSTTHRIALIPGDGIGKEVAPEGMRVVQAAAQRFGLSLEVTEFDWASCDWYLKHGEMMPPDWKAQLQGMDAIFFGAVGWPATVPDHISLWGSLLKFRREFDQYVNLRPVRLFDGVPCPLAGRKPGDLDYLIVRENTEGEYTNLGGIMFAGTEREVVIQESVFSRHGTDRVLKYAFELAKQRARKHLTVATKSNGVAISMPWWDGRADAMAVHYPDVAVDRFGRLDIVIANAGITLFGDFLSYPETDLRRVLDLNAAGTFLLAQAAARQMVSQGTGGSLLFMSSVVGHQAHKGLAAYAMTKAALEMLAKNLVIELSGYGINVNTVAPGATLTERTLEDANYTAIWSEITPMRRPATVADIAAAARFLVSDEARHITGQSLIIDGGWTSVSPNPY